MKPQNIRKYHLTNNKEKKITAMRAILVYRIEVNVVN